MSRALHSRASTGAAPAAPALNYNAGASAQGKLAALQESAQVEAAKGAALKQSASTDYIEYNKRKAAAQLEIARERFQQLVAIPADDVAVREIDRQGRRGDAGVRSAPEFARYALDFYGATKWTVASRQYERYAGYPSISAARAAALEKSPPQEYELDDAPDWLGSGAIAEEDEGVLPSSAPESTSSADAKVTADAHAFLAYTPGSSEAAATAARQRGRVELAHLHNDSELKPLYQPRVAQLPVGDGPTLPFEDSGAGVRRIRVHVQSIVFDFCNSEPFWGSITLFDVGSGKRISETCYFEMRMGGRGDADGGIPPASFAIASSSCDQAFALIRLERILQGDLSSLYEKYASLKGRAPSTEEQTSVRRRLGAYRQPWAWAAVPLLAPGVDANTPLAGALRQSALFRVEDDKCSDDEMCSLMNALSRGGILKKAKVIPGHVSVAVDDAAPAETTLSALPTAPSYAQFTSYENVLFVYPIGLNLARVNVGRNIYCRVEFLTRSAVDGASKNTARRAVFGSRAPNGPPQEFADTAVTYHSKNTAYYEEFKAKLPTDLTDLRTWHLRFTLYHITCKEKKEKQDTESEIGTAFLPLFQPKAAQWVSSGAYQLPLATALGPNYVEDPDSAQHRWLDGRKPLLTVQLCSVNSLFPDSPQIVRLLKLASGSLAEADDASQVQAVEQVSEAPDTVLAQNAVFVIEALLGLIAAPAARDNVRQAAFKQLNAAVHTLMTRVPVAHGLDTLRNLVHYWICGNSHAKNALPLHAALLGEWRRAISATAENTLTLLASTAWFLFEVIAKSAFRHPQSGPQGLDAQMTNDLGVVVTGLSNELSRRGGAALAAAKKVNAMLAHFLNDALRFTSVEKVFGLVHYHVMLLDAAAMAPTPSGPASAPSQGRSAAEAAWPLATLKFTFLTIIASGEHFVALNLPLASYASSGSNRVSGTLSEYWRRHFLVGVVLNDVRKTLKHPNAYLRLACLSVLKNILVKHTLDDRFANPTCRARIAAMYWPLVLLCCDHEPRLVAQHTPGDSSGVANSEEPLSQSSNGDHAVALETSTLLLCFLLVIGPLQDEVILKWLSRAETARRESFYSLLRLSLSVFQYPGRHCAAQRLDAVQPGVSTFSLTQDAKRALEEMYSGGQVGMSSALMQSRGRRPVSSRTSTRTFAPGASGEGALGVAPPLGATGARLSLANLTAPSPASNGGVEPAAAAPALPAHRHTMPPSLAQLSGPTNAGSNLSLGSLGTGENLSGRSPQSDSIAKLAGLQTYECSLLVLQVLESALQDYLTHEYTEQRIVAQPKSLAELDRFFGVYVSLLSHPQSAMALEHVFASLRNFIYRFGRYVIVTKNSICPALTRALLAHAAAAREPAHIARAVGLLYLLVRRNYSERNGTISKMKTQASVALSQMELCENPDAGSNETLIRAVGLLERLASADRNSLSNRFVQLTHELVVLLVSLAHDASKISAFRYDPELVAELHVRMAASYANNSPDLRLASLNALADIHRQAGNLAEAALCLLQGCKLVSEYLQATKQLDWGDWSLARAWRRASANPIAAEMDDPSILREDGVCDSPPFSRESFVGALERAMECFRQAGHYESAREVAQMLLFLREDAGQSAECAALHEKLRQDWLEVMSSSIKRIAGTYFRVGFFGAGFGPMDGLEFVYKEKPYTPLADICGRLKARFSARFGDGFVLIQDSAPIDRSQLDPDRAYAQVTALLPYWESADASSVWGRSYGVNTFIYETPFVPKTGKARGAVDEQWIRKTILTTARRLPDLERRSRIVAVRTVELNPLEVAIEALADRTAKLEQLLAPLGGCGATAVASAVAIATLPDVADAVPKIKRGPQRDSGVNAAPAAAAPASSMAVRDPKALQLLLQGSVRLQVNAGSLEYARLFLGPVARNETLAYPLSDLARLAAAFEAFLSACTRGLAENRALIKDDQVQYQEDLEAGMAELSASLAPFLAPFRSTASNQRPARLRSCSVNSASSSASAVNARAAATPAPEASIGGVAGPAPVEAIPVTDAPPAALAPRRLTSGSGSSASMAASLTNKVLGFAAASVSRFNGASSPASASAPPQSSKSPQSLASSVGSPLPLSAQSSAGPASSAGAPQPMRFSTPPPVVAPPANDVSLRPKTVLGPSAPQTPPPYVVTRPVSAAPPGKSSPTPRPASAASTASPTSANGQVPELLARFAARANQQSGSN